MSEDDYSGLGRNDGHHHHKKGPRFSWTPAYEATFFRSLCESVQMGIKDTHAFKQEAWDRAMQALQERHGAYPNKGHLINKSDNARKKFRLWRGLREDPEFLYNPATRMVTASEEAWKAHVEREPLSRSLKGRPFEHEEYFEILFPDVIGSGGAPKRIVKPKRKGPDNIPGAEESDTPGLAVLNLLNDGDVTQNQSAVSTGATAPPPAPPPAPPSGPTQQRAIAMPPRASIVSASALTPPDESLLQTRKRFAPPDGPLYTPADKRRRTAHNNYIDLTHPAQQAAGGGGPGSAQSRYDNIAFLAEALSKSAGPPRWPEMAMEVFFRDFADEDMDLQLKIAEKVLTDSSKAAMFCKMPVPLRKHWIKRLRDTHNRQGN